MKFDLVKKGYNQAQVDEYIQKLTQENNQIVTQQKTAIEQLKQENDELSSKIASYDKKKEEIFVAFVEAQETSAKLKRKAEQRFAEEMERLKLFQQKWTNYSKELVKTLSADDAEDFAQMSNKFNQILAIYAKDVEIAQPQLQKQSKQADKSFDPIKKVSKFLDNFEEIPVETKPQPIVQEADVVDNQVMEENQPELVVDMATVEEETQQVEEIAEEIELVSQDIDETIHEPITLEEQAELADQVAEILSDDQLQEEICTDAQAEEIEEVETQLQPDFVQEQTQPLEDEREVLSQQVEEVVEDVFGDQNKPDNIAQQVSQLMQEDEFDVQDISQSDVYNVQQSLEDLCKELGLIEDK